MREGIVWVYGTLNKKDLLERGLSFFHINQNPWGMYLEEWQGDDLRVFIKVQQKEAHLNENYQDVE